MLNISMVLCHIQLSTYLQDSNFRAVSAITSDMDQMRRSEGRERGSDEILLRCLSFDSKICSIGWSCCCFMGIPYTYYMHVRVSEARPKCVFSSLINAFRRFGGRGRRRSQMQNFLENQLKLSKNPKDSHLRLHLVLTFDGTIPPSRLTAFP